MSSMIDLKISNTEHCKIPESIKSSNIMYDIGDYINEGGNASVFVCSEQRSGQEFAIKFLTKVYGKRLKRFKQEQQIHQQIKHDHIVKYVCDGKISGEFYKGKRNRGKKEIPYVIMEKCDETLHEYLQRSASSIPYHDYIAQFRGLTEALSVLHKIAIHRDIKPTNILVKDGVWKLSDFGLCAFTDLDKSKDITTINEKVGPMNWMSPESNTKFAGFNSDIVTQSDVFQLASIFWLVVNKRHPTGVLTKDDWDGPDNLFAPLFKSLQHSPDRRPTNGDMFHQSMVDAIEIV